MAKRYNLILPLLVLVLATACVSSGPPQVPAAESPGPALVVERFLRAANANDLETMTQLFGSEDRNIVELEGRTQAQQRMYVLASLVRHEDWAIRGQRTVPGRIMDATQLLVELTQEDGTTVVPFLVVRKKGGGWIIEKIDVEELTRVRG